MEKTSELNKVVKDPFKKGSEVKITKGLLKGKYGIIIDILNRNKNNEKYLLDIKGMRIKIKPEDLIH